MVDGERVLSSYSSVEVFQVEQLTPSRMTLLVGTLHAMEGVENRAEVVVQALDLEDESTTLWFIESVIMAAWFHANQEPLVRMVGGTGVPAAMSEDGRLIAFSGLDFAKWTPDVAPDVREFTAACDPFSDRREFWVAGRVSPLFLKNFGEMGWTVRTDVRQQTLPVIPWDYEGPWDEE